MSNEQTDWRALCARLATILDSKTGYTKPDGTRWSLPVVIHTRDLLAQSEPKGAPVTDLPLAPRAILYAAKRARTSGLDDCLNDSRFIAAALRAAADLGRRGPEYWEGSHPDDFDEGWDAAMDWVANIALELDPVTPTNDHH
jgi:hypothetical protein